MAEIAGDTVTKMSPGDYTFAYLMSAGTAVLHIADPSDADSTYQVVTDSDKSASATFNLSLKGTANIKVVLTGDAKCFLMDGAF